VGAGGTAGGAGLGHFLPGAHQVALAYAQPRVVRIAGDVAVAVVHVHDVAVAALHPGKAHHAVGHRHHRVTDAGMEIDTLVAGRAAAERVGAGAEAGGHVAVADRHARGHGV